MTYQTSHPWLTFKLDLRRLPADFWILAGEAVSKCEHLAGVALDPETASKLMTVYLAKGALATTAIEGNTLTEDEARRRVEGRLRLPPSKEYLGVEIDNIVAASNALAEQYGSGAPLRITCALIERFNRDVLRGLALDEQVVPGKLRTYSVGVADYRGAPAGDLAELLDRLCEWLERPWLNKARRDKPARSPLERANQRRLEAILKAIVAHLYLAWIHPFGDGNGRTARLLEFALLLFGGVPLPAAHLLSNHYNETRSEYYRQLSYASKSGGDVTRFCLYAVQGLADQLRTQINVVRERQLELFWRHHLHSELGDSETGRRRRYLVLDLQALDRPVPRGKLTDVSVRVLRHYDRFSDKTLLRDVKELERRRLIRRVDGGYMANPQVVMAYMPAPFAAPETD